MNIRNKPIDDELRNYFSRAGSSGDAEVGRSELQELTFGEYLVDRALISREQLYADLYVDLVKTTSELLDAYFWLDNDEAANLAEPLRPRTRSLTASRDPVASALTGLVEGMAFPGSRTRSLSDDSALLEQILMRVIRWRTATWHDSEAAE